MTQETVLTGKILVPLSVLQKISDKNLNTYNRSVDVEAIKNRFPSLERLQIHSAFYHEHAFGKKVEGHLRVSFVFNDYDGQRITLFQDMSFKQFEWCIEVYQLEKECGIVD